MKNVTTELIMPPQPPVDSAAWEKAKAAANTVGWKVKGCEKCPPLVVSTRPAGAP